MPVWAGITTPPAVLLLALAGAVALAWRGARRPLDALRNTPTRFGLLLIALPVATAVAVVVLENNVYDGWRHLYFLYAPALLLAVTGLHWLLRGRWGRMGAYALAGVAVGVAVVSMVRIHPHEANYFNALVDRTTPERLASRYGMSPQRHSHWTVVAGILAAHPSGTLFGSLFGAPAIPDQLLPADDRERLIRTRDFRSGDRNFFSLPAPAGRCPGGPHDVRLYANALRCVVDPVAYFGAARRQALAGEPVARARYDVYRDGRRLTWVWDGCPAEEVEEGAPDFFLHVHPRDAADLPGWRAKQGHDFDNLDWVPRAATARIDGNCVAVALLPDYPIARVRTGEIGAWSADVPPDYAGARRDALATEPLARGEFAIYRGRAHADVRAGRVHG